MKSPKSSPLNQLLSLTSGLMNMPHGWKRIIIAFAYGITCHIIFVLAVGVMIISMFFGMSKSLGNVPQPACFLTNALLLLQFPVTHSLLLSQRGKILLSWIAPKQHFKTLSTTTYAIVASLQLLFLFLLWTPSDIVWWRAEGAALYVLCCLYTFSWLLLIKSSIDAGAEVQSGALGWMSMAQNKTPTFPDMPTKGLFSVVRQPIYVSFSLTLWTVPVWTPDQFSLAVVLTFYCVFAPRLKERRFKKLYGDRFLRYQKAVPYAIPRLYRTKNNG